MYTQSCLLTTPWSTWKNHFDIIRSLDSGARKLWSVALLCWCVLMHWYVLHWWVLHWSVCCWIGVWCLVLHCCVVCGAELVCGTDMCCTVVWWELLDSHEKLHALKHTSLSRSGARYIMDFNWLYAQNIRKSTHKIHFDATTKNTVSLAPFKPCCVCSVPSIPDRAFTIKVTWHVELIQ